MKKLLALYVILIFTNTSRAQDRTRIQVSGPGKVTFEQKAGQWTFAPYAGNVVKATFLPAGYLTNELITDAVIAKPVSKLPIIKGQLNEPISFQWNDVKIVIWQDTLYIGSDVIVTGYHRSAEYKGFRFLLQEDEKIFGAGERALPLNRRGYRFNLYNSPHYGYGMGADNLNYSVPFITSSKNYALFFDNASKGYLDIGKANPNVLEYGAVSGELNFYIILGETYPEILSSYHKLTGTQPIPPLWAMGNFLSRFGYMSETQIRDIKQKMDEFKIPYDAVIFDLFWFGDSIKGTMGNLDWVNKKAWPNPAKMISDFSKEGTKTILITEPFVLKSSLNYAVAKKFLAVDSLGRPYDLSDFYFGSGGLIDIFRNAGKDWFWSKYKAQMNKGVEAWWGDLGEPEKHPANLYHNLNDRGFKRLFKADGVHNAYGHYWTKMLFDKYAQEYPSKRLFSLNRSGFAGTQRYGIYPWTGDVSRSWSGLQAQLPVILGMSMSGVPYVHSDAGGFAGGEKDPELYIRWLQFASYTPIFRPHGTELSRIDTTVSNYPSEAALFDEPYRSIAKQIIEERYKMLPYNYTLSYRQAKDGSPLISPLYYYYQNDTATYNIEDEFMWGENILVAPVIQKGAVVRNVYLPQGKWYSNDGLTAFDGRQWRTDSLQLNGMPVYIREGSFIPTIQGPLKNTTNAFSKPLTIHYYSSALPSYFELFQDDGETNNSIQKNLFELIKFESTGITQNGAFTITSNNGNYKGKPASRSITLAIHSATRYTSVKVNGSVIKINNGDDITSEAYMKDGAIYIKLSFSGKPVKIEIATE